MNKPNIVIVEQPTSKPIRLRYESEVRSAVTIPGANSTSERKTYPTIKIVNYTGPVLIITSCVTSNEPYRPHPYNLIGTDGCANGFSKINFNASPENEFCFQNLSIQCTTKQNLHESLAIRQQFKIDPFKTKFVYEENYKDIDLASLRLCFQAFLKPKNQTLLVPLCKPVESAVIFKKKSNTDLVIVRISDTTSFPIGGKQIILLCEKIVKNDIKIRFHQLHNNIVVWEDYGVFHPRDVHHQVAITFRTPKYSHSTIDHPVDVLITLQRRSDGAESEPHPFQYVPTFCSRKKRNATNMEFNDFQKHRKTQDSIALVPDNSEFHGNPEAAAHPISTPTQGAVGYNQYAGYAPPTTRNQTNEPNKFRNSFISNTISPSSSITHWNNIQNTPVFNIQCFQQSQLAHIRTQTQWNISPQHQQHQYQQLQHPHPQQSQQPSTINQMHPLIEMPPNNYYQHLQFPAMVKNDLTSNPQPAASSLPCLELNSSELEMHAQANMTNKPEDMSEMLELRFADEVENMTDSFNMLSAIGV